MSQSRTDSRLSFFLRISALISAAIVVLILLFLTGESWPVLHHIAIRRFFTDPSWHPAQSLYNLTPMISATLFSTLGALILAVPLGIASALFSRFYAPPMLAISYRRLIELLAGIPSVAYGFWGLTTLASLIGDLHPPGVSLLTGILVLSLMILPTVALTVDAALASLPLAYLRGAAALGLSRWETAALIYTSGYVDRMPDSLSDSGRALSVHIYDLSMNIAGGDAKAHAAALVLIMILFVINTTAMALANHWRHRRITSL